MIENKKSEHKMLVFTAFFKTVLYFTHVRMLGVFLK